MQPNDPAGGQLGKTILTSILTAIEAAEDELGRLDAAAGDGDHGAGMCRGFRAATTAVADFDGGLGETLGRAGTAFTDAAGGASGALVGSWLSAIGQSLAGADAIDAATVGRALAAGQGMIQRLGKAKPGDKTMLDTLDPFLSAYNAAVTEGADIAAAWSGALPAAEAGMRATAAMTAKRGRSARLAERSVGHVDAGATSLYYVLRAAGGALAQPD